MALFDFKGRDGRSLIPEAYDLALAYQKPPPLGWVRLTAADLGSSPEKVDELGFASGR